MVTVVSFSKFSVLCETFPRYLSVFMLWSEICENVLFQSNNSIHAECSFPWAEDNMLHHYHKAAITKCGVWELKVIPRKFAQNSECNQSCDLVYIQSNIGQNIKTVLLQWIKCVKPWTTMPEKHPKKEEFGQFLPKGSLPEKGDTVTENLCLKTNNAETDLQKIFFVPFNPLQLFSCTAPFVQQVRNPVTLNRDYSCFCGV